MNFISRNSAGQNIIGMKNKTKVTLPLSHVTVV